MPQFIDFRQFPKALVFSLLFTLSACIGDDQEDGTDAGSFLGSVGPSEGRNPLPDEKMADSDQGIDNTIVTVFWRPNPGTVDGYIVYFGPSVNAVNEETSDIKAFAGNFDPSSPLIQYDSWFDLGLAPGDQACFKVRAYNADGISDWSAPACSLIPQAI
jgi:hypothetical protein